MAWPPKRVRLGRWYKSASRIQHDTQFSNKFLFASQSRKQTKSTMKTLVSLLELPFYIFHQLFLFVLPSHRFFVYMIISLLLCIFIFLNKKPNSYTQYCTCSWFSLCSPSWPPSPSLNGLARITVVVSFASFLTSLFFAVVVGVCVCVQHLWCETRVLVWSMIFSVSLFHKLTTNQPSTMATMEVTPLHRTPMVDTLHHWPMVVTTALTDTGRSKKLFINKKQRLQCDQIITAHITLLDLSPAIKCYALHDKNNIKTISFRSFFSLLQKWSSIRSIFSVSHFVSI